MEDSITGLVWEGGTSSESLFASAAAHCDDLNTNSYAGRTDWRLPVRRELMAIWDLVGWNSYNAVIPSEFGTQPQNSIWWTSTPVATASGQHWACSGNWAWLSWVEDADTNYDGHYVRCVSGPPLPIDRWTPRDSGTVVWHESTDLEWHATPSATSTWAGALAYCEGSTLAGKTDWRLPTFKELYSVTDESATTQPAMSSAFNLAGGEVFWTSTPTTDTEIYAVHANSGIGSTLPTGSTAGVALCVRDAT